MRGDYVPNFKVPGPKRPSGRMWGTVLLCVIVPPVGVILLWSRARCPLRGKVLLSVLSAALMVAGLTWYMETQSVKNAVVPDVPAVVHNYGATPTPLPAPAAPAAPDAQPDGGLPEGVIPANPAG